MKDVLRVRPSKDDQLWTSPRDGRDGTGVEWRGDGDGGREANSVGGSSHKHSNTKIQTEGGVGSSSVPVTSKEQHRSNKPRLKLCVVFGLMMDNYLFVIIER